MRRKVDKETLLSVGTSLLHKQGYNATGIKEIADAAGILKGSFYNYFEGKEAFCYAALEKYGEDSTKCIREILENKALSPLTRLKTLFSYRINSMVSDQNCSKGCFIGNIAQELSDSNEAVREFVDQSMSGETEMIQECLSEAKSIGEVSESLNVEKAAEFIVMSWQGALLRMKASKDEHALKTYYQMIFEQFL